MKLIRIRRPKGRRERAASAKAEAGLLRLRADIGASSAQSCDRARIGDRAWGASPWYARPRDELLISRCHSARANLGSERDQVEQIFRKE